LYDGFIALVFVGKIFIGEFENSEEEKNLKIELT